MCACNILAQESGCRLVVFSLFLGDSVCIHFVAPSWPVRGRAASIGLGRPTGEGAAPRVWVDPRLRQGLGRPTTDHNHVIEVSHRTTATTANTNRLEDAGQEVHWAWRRLR